MFSFSFGNSVDPKYTKSLRSAEKSESEVLKTYKKLNSLHTVLVKAQAREKQLQNAPGFFNRMRNARSLKEKIDKKETLDKSVVASETFAAIPLKYAQLREDLAANMVDIMNFVMDEVNSAARSSSYSFESRVSETKRRIEKIQESVRSFDASITKIFDASKIAAKQIENKANAERKMAVANGNSSTVSGGAKRRRRSTVKKVTKKRVTKKRVTKKRRSTRRA
jgi:hypothetical protein